MPSPVSWPQVLILAILQGISELFPISSLGHTVLLPAFLGWGNLQASETFLPFVVLLHLGTAAALVWFYRQEWARVVQAFVASAVRGRLARTPDEHLAWLLFFGTIPTAVIAAVLEGPIKHLFATPLVAAVFLMVNGLVMLASERLRTRTRLASSTLAGPPAGGDEGSAAADGPEGRRAIKDLTWRDATIIGLAQALALIPGLSRSGVTMCACLLRDMRHEAAAHYTFMLATPLIAGAALLEVPDLLVRGAGVFGPAATGGVVAAVTAYFSVRFLTRYFRVGRLDPFAYYCLAIGLVGVLFVAAHRV